MSDYDFKTLNDKEFEILCTDLLGDVEGQRFERFKPGKDSGIDGRFFASNGSEVILQCKHWCGTPTRQLIQALSSIEKIKIDKIKPQRYILAISNALSRADKKKIKDTLSPYLQSESDIYGKEDLNDLLTKKPEIEKRHYKLWLQSTYVIGHILNHSVIGRSEFSLQETLNSSAKYAVTENHQLALDRLEELHVVIITGEPGVGKTTLADHLCLHYVAQEFNYIKITDEVREAESIFTNDSKQVFYFDDFLGRNYLEALKGHEGNQITQFIRRVSSHKNKRFILTSRSTILNQGKLLIDSFEHNNLERNEFELKIKSLSELDKAYILYNHIWHSGLEKDYIDQLYINKRYKLIISHKNFNPRLISYITDVTRLESFNASEYWSYIQQSLDNPSLIWENPFIAQQDDFGRAIIFIAVLNGKEIAEKKLAEAFYLFTALPCNHNFHGRRDFQSNIRQLTGSFLNRKLINQTPSIDLFNPSIGDYVLQRYKNDVNMLKHGMQSLRSSSSLTTLLSLQRNGDLSKNDFNSICNFIVDALADCNFQGVSTSYISLLCVYRIIESNSDEITFAKNWKKAVIFILNNSNENATYDSFTVIEWALSENEINDEQALDFVERHLDTIGSDDEIRAASSLVSTISKEIERHPEILDLLKEHTINLIGDNFCEFIDVNDAFSKVQDGEYNEAKKEIENLIEIKLNELNIEYETNDIKKISDSYHISYELDRYYEVTGDDYYNDDYRSTKTLAINEIDELFDRS